MATDNEVTGHPERTEEFDAFGPWVFTVHTPDEVPRLFRRFMANPADAEVVIKVPRPIVRREANPQMDLYDHLLALRGDTLTLLSRAPGDAGGVRRRQVTVDQLLAIEETVELLDGRLVVRVADERPLEVPYNAVSRDVVGAFVKRLRLAWRAAVGVSVPVQIPAPMRLALGDLGHDVALVTEFREVAEAEPGMVALAGYERRTVEPVDAGALTRLLHRWWPMWLQGAVVCSDGVELQVLHRRSWWVRSKKPVLSVGRTVLMLGRTAPVEVVGTAYRGVSEIRVHHDAASFPVVAGSPIERYLLDLLS
jgi:hypothetical protein